ncbi:hypothetical protein BDQ17DRAFT_1491391 [Cyathus striatus]|nr:hypothetical protein BDQ17DRAFT_1491391 [Cyathus striatus]
MQLDILYEILGYLEPIDLVQLTRTSKAFKKFLLANSALFTWKIARSNLDGTPECPEDMSEPAYASLIFENHCLGCQSRHSVVHCWEIRARWCKKCILADKRFVFFG